MGDPCPHPAWLNEHINIIIKYTLSETSRRVEKMPKTYMINIDYNYPFSISGNKQINS